MNINRNNYAEFFIDFFDGNLNDADTALLFSFLNEHPDLKAEFDAFEIHTLKPDAELTFANKAELKKSNINLQNYQTYLIAKIENDLDETGTEELNTFINKHPYIQFEAQLFEKTKLTAGNEKFRAKEKLKKPVIIPFYANYKYQMAVAAAIAMLLLFTQVFLNTNPQDSIATNTTIDTAPTIKSKSDIEKSKLASAPLIDEKVEQIAEANVTEFSKKTYRSSAKKIPVFKIKELAVPIDENNYIRLTGLPVDLTSYSIETNTLQKETDQPVYASVINEALNPNTESQFSELTGETISKLTNNTVNIDSKKTKSGLMKSWKLQAGNFSIAHTKN